MKPSHDKIHKPGNEGSCPAMPTETINGKSFPNGDNSHPSVSVNGLPSSPDKGMRSHASDGANPKPAMPGA